MTREIEGRLEEVMDELSWLANQDEISDQQAGMLKAAEASVSKVFAQKQNARYMKEWPDGSRSVDSGTHSEGDQ